MLCSVCYTFWNRTDPDTEAKQNTLAAWNPIPFQQTSMVLRNNFVKESIFEYIKLAQ